MTMQTKQHAYQLDDHAEENLVAVHQFIECLSQGI